MHPTANMPRIPSCRVRVPGRPPARSHGRYQSSIVVYFRLGIADLPVSRVAAAALPLGNGCAFGVATAAPNAHPPMTCGCPTAGSRVTCRLSGDKSGGGGEGVMPRLCHAQETAFHERGPASGGSRLDAAARKTAPAAAAGLPVSSSMWCRLSPQPTYRSLTRPAVSGCGAGNRRPGRSGQGDHGDAVPVEDLADLRVGVQRGEQLNFRGPAPDDDAARDGHPVLRVTAPSPGRARSSSAARRVKRRAGPRDAASDQRPRTADG